MSWKVCISMCDASIPRFMYITWINKDNNDETQEFDAIHKETSLM